METTIYFGNRQNEFTQFIINMLEMGKLKTHYIELLTNKNSLALYDIAFTHPSANSGQNYELFEFLGDSSLNKAIVWYLFRRFPQLNCPAGVKILSRLKINLVSKKMFADIGDHMNAWPFISASVEIKQNKMKKLLEDCLEAFIGVTEYIIDTKIRRDAGYSIIYNIIEAWFDKLDISLKYEDLFDAKTRLKELFDYFKHIGTFVYTANKIPDPAKLEYFKFQANVVWHKKDSREEVVIGQGVASLKIDAEQHAAESALRYMKKEGYFKEVSMDYMTCI